MRYIITAPMRRSGAIGLFCATSLDFETDETNPEDVKYWGIVASMQKGFQVDSANIYVLNSSGDYVYPAGLEQSKGG